MKILILNWRDIKNPSSGGAEILTQEIAKRWVTWGHQVIQFSSSFSGCLEEEIVDGVKIIRKGHPDARHIFDSVQFLAFWYYLRNWKNTFDVVIDEVHGLPFFTPCYIKAKKVALICEVADSLWREVFGLAFGSLGWATEKLYIRFIYRNIPFLTISPSTKKDLLLNGVSEKRITVLPMGISIPQKVAKVKKEKNPTLLFVARLIKTKGVEDAIFVIQEIVKTWPDAKLWIVGRGEDQYLSMLRTLMKKLGVADKTILFGFVSEEEKFKLMGRAHVLLHPSVREGFGLIVPEAGFMGTPTVAYNTSGMRDVVKNGINGILVKQQSPKLLADAVKNLFKNKLLYKKLSKGAKKEARQYNWDTTARMAISVLENRTI